MKRIVLIATIVVPMIVASCSSSNDEFKRPSVYYDLPWITMVAGMGAGIWYLIREEVTHKKTARYDVALSKIYTQLERFIVAANKVRVNINTMPLDLLLENKSKDMDEWITYSIYEIENMSLLTEMFFETKDRGFFKDIVRAAINFKYELHKAASVLDNTSKLSIYDEARVNFNKEYNAGMKGLVDMINKRLLGQWEYDLTGVRLSKRRCILTRYKRHYFF